ncbi:hypothetical protein EJ110_NYTH11371 [Nymphaea thermarum]|nr:hypothetical protein EJ110_NYTH11371 [Nymphaea thermarum]
MPLPAPAVAWREVSPLSLPVSAVCVAWLLLGAVARAFAAADWEVSPKSSDASTVSTDRADVGVLKTENVPVQVTTIRLTKDNYLRWSAAITMGIVGRGRINYVDGKMTEPPESSSAWDTWFLVDNHVKTWIVNFVPSDIQSFILRKRTPRDVWVILEQIPDAVWGPKTEKQVVWLNDDFEGIRSHILNLEDMVSIEDAYSHIEAEEQRHLVMTGKGGARSSCSERSAVVSRAPMGTP